MLLAIKSGKPGVSSALIRPATADSLPIFSNAITACSLVCESLCLIISIKTSTAFPLAISPKAFTAARLTCSLLSLVASHSASTVPTPPIFPNISVELKRVYNSLSLSPLCKLLNIVGFIRPMGMMSVSKICGYNFHLLYILLITSVVQLLDSMLHSTMLLPASRSMLTKISSFSLVIAWSNGNGSLINPASKLNVSCQSYSQKCSLAIPMVSSALFI